MYQQHYPKQTVFTFEIQRHSLSLTHVLLHGVKVSSENETNTDSDDVTPVMTRRKRYHSTKATCKSTSELKLQI